MSEIQQLLAWVSAYAGDTREKARADERGAADLATVVILIALFAAAAIAIATIIITKFTDKANNIPTG
jgi:hypothetical protein